MRKGSQSALTFLFVVAISPLSLTFGAIDSCGDENCTDTLGEGALSCRWSARMATDGTLKLPEGFIMCNQENCQQQDGCYPLNQTIHCCCSGECENDQFLGLLNNEESICLVGNDMRKKPDVCKTEICSVVLSDDKTKVKEFLCEKKAVEFGEGEERFCEDDESGTKCYCKQQDLLSICNAEDAFFSDTKCMVGTGDDIKSTKCLAHEAKSCMRNQMDAESGKIFIYSCSENECYNQELQTPMCDADDTCCCKGGEAPCNTDETFKSKISCYVGSSKQNGLIPKGCDLAVDACMTTSYTVFGETQAHYSCDTQRLCKTKGCINTKINLQTDTGLTVFVDGKWCCCKENGCNEADNLFKYSQIALAGLLSLIIICDTVL